MSAAQFRTILFYFRYLMYLYFYFLKREKSKLVFVWTHLEWFSLTSEINFSVLHLTALSSHVSWVPKCSVLVTPLNRPMAKVLGLYANVPSSNHTPDHYLDLSWEVRSRVTSITLCDSKLACLLSVGVFNCAVCVSGSEKLAL